MLSERLGQPFVVENRGAAGQQHRRRSGRARAAGRLHAAVHRQSECHQRDAQSGPQFQFHARHRAGRRRRPQSASPGGQSVLAGEIRSRTHRLCQGASGRNQYGVRRHRLDAASRRRTVQDDDRRQHAACAVSRRRARGHRPARRPSPGHVRPDHPVANRAYPRRPTARARRHQREAHRRSCRICRTVADFVPGYEAFAWQGIGAPKDTPPDIIAKLNSEINAAPRRSQDHRSASPISAASRCR